METLEKCECVMIRVTMWHVHRCHRMFTEILKFRWHFAIELFNKCRVEYDDLPVHVSLGGSIKCHPIFVNTYHIETHPMLFAENIQCILRDDYA